MSNPRTNMVATPSHAGAQGQYRPRTVRGRRTTEGRQRKHLVASLKRAIWHPIRLLGMVTAGILGAFLLFQLFVKIIHPFRLGEEEARKVAALRVRLTRQQAKNRQLEADLKFLKTDEGKEKLARRIGFHYKGEKVVLLDNDARNAAETGTVTPTPPDSAKP